MLRLHAVVRRLITSWSMGQPVPEHAAREAASQFESGHVCRNCESQIVRLPGGEYSWCPTCGVETSGHISDICMCGAHVGRHDAQLRCAPVKEWADETNPLLRRKVNVDVRQSASPKAPAARSGGIELFEQEDCDE